MLCSRCIVGNSTAGVRRYFEAGPAKLCEPRSKFYCLRTLAQCIGIYCKHHHVSFQHSNTRTKRVGTWRVLNSSGRWRRCERRVVVERESTLAVPVPVVSHDMIFRLKVPTNNVLRHRWLSLQSAWAS